MRTEFGENVLVLGGAEMDNLAIESGSTVSLTGAWMSRGSGGVRLFSGHTEAQSQYCFVGEARGGRGAARGRCACGLPSC